MDALKSLIQPLVGGAGGSSVVDGMKLVVLGGTVETARRVSSSAWSHFVNSFFLTAHFSEEDYPYDWLMLWLSRRPEWQRSREFETTTRTSGPGGSNEVDEWDLENDIVVNNEDRGWGDDAEGRPKTRVVFQPTFDTTHTIYYKGHWLRVRRSRNQDNCEMLSISVVARSNLILKQLVLQAKKDYEAEAIHRIQIYFADVHGSWRWTDSRHKRPMASIVLNPGVKEMLLDDTRDFLKSEKWYADRGIPFRRGYLLHGVPGSGKSSLIHALAGQLQLDIYVVSLSASWISDSTLTALMGRVPARCVVLLEDLDAAFTRSVSREDEDHNEDNKDNENKEGNSHSMGPSRRRRGRGGDHLSDVNTLSLSGLLNALDGVAAAEGRLLFATTNHLERLDPALSRPGRMDVWIEFKNASKWQAEALFRNFFPCEEDEEELAKIELAKVELAKVASDVHVHTPTTPTSSTSSIWSLPSGITSSANSLLSGSRTTPSASPPSSSTSSRRHSAVPVFPSPSEFETTLVLDPSTQFGASNTAYLPPPPEPSILKNRHSAAPLDRKQLSVLAQRFADGVPEEEFSVAALQGYLLKYKAQPEAAANNIGEWVISEREMRERLQKEKEARELKEKALREKRRKDALEKAQEKKMQESKEAELERVKQRLAEKEKEEELAKMRAQLAEKEKEDEERKKKEREEAEKKGKIVTETKVEDSVVPDSPLSEDSDQENIPPQSAIDSETSSSSSSWGDA